MVSTMIKGFTSSFSSMAGFSNGLGANERIGEAAFWATGATRFTPLFYTILSVSMGPVSFFAPDVEG